MARFVEDNSGFLRRVAFLASPGWKEHAGLYGSLPLLVLLHDELTLSRPGAMLARFAPAIRGAGPDLGLGIRFLVVAPEGLSPAMQAARQLVPDSRPGSLVVPPMTIPGVPGGATPVLDDGFRDWLAERALLESARPSFLASGAWASGHRGSEAAAFVAEDVHLVERAIHAATEAFQIDGVSAVDTQRVCIAGHGNGGELALHLPSELSAAVASAGRPYSVNVSAVAVVSGGGAGYEAIDVGLPKHHATLPSPRIPVFFIHGGQDDDFPVSGSSVAISERIAQVLGWQNVPRDYAPHSHSIRTSWDYWRSSDWQNSGLETVYPNGVPIRGYEYTDAYGALAARVWVDDAMGHDWPLPGTPGTWDIGAAIVEFFASFV